MAKKKQTKKPAAEKTTTYSTRLNEEQKEHLEQAAAFTGVSASRFIRDATLRAAADVVNATAPHDRAISAIAQLLADSISNQHAELEYLYEDDQVSRVKASLNNGYLSLSQDQGDDEYELRKILVSIKINTLAPQEVRQLNSIAESCPFAFAQAFTKAMRGVGEPLPEFTPRSNPDRLLSD